MRGSSATLRCIAVPLERWSRENSDLPETYPTGV
jgi:hypothetical protein